MFSIFWKSLFVGTLFLMLWINIAFTFDMVQLINPTAFNLDYSNYYFGVSSFIDQFKAYFQHSTVLQGFQDFLSNLATVVSDVFNNFVQPLRMNTPNSQGYDVITAIIGVLLLLVNSWPLLISLFYSICYVIYLLVFAFTVVLFIVSFFAGSFATPLPSTDWWEFVPPVLDSAFTII